MAPVLELPELEQRLSTLQSQVERLWRQAEANVPPVEQRLAAMADQYAEYLRRWAATVERHTHAVAQLETYAAEWKDSSTRVRQETEDRLHDLETTIEREWDSLRRMAEEPVKQLRAQAESLTEVSQAMVTATQRGVDLAEARFATFESDVHRRLSELTHELHSALAEIRLRLDQEPQRLDPSRWSLDDVTRLHGQLRDSGPRGASGLPDIIDQPALPAATEPTTGDEQPDAQRLRRSIAERFSADEPGRPPFIPTKWRAAVVVLAVSIVIVGAILGWRMQRQIRAAAERARLAELKSDAAVTDASKQAEVARQEAARQISAAREMANRAQRTADVLAAPDLIRFSLSGGNGASGQALFSRSRGFVVSGSHLPPPPPNGTHQVWLLTRFAPVKAGTFVPEPDGTITLVQQTPAVPRAVVGVMITAEPSEPSGEPAGATVLSSIARAQDPAEEN